MLVTAVTPNYPPASRVGAWLSTHECLRGMIAAGHEVVVASLHGNGGPYELDGVKIWQGAKHVQELVAAADVVVSHYGDNGVAHGAARAAGLPSVRVFNAVLPPGEISALNRPERVPDLAVFVADTLSDSVPGEFQRVTVPSVIWPEEHRTTPGDMVTLVNLIPLKGVRTFTEVARRCGDVRFLGVLGGYGGQQRPRLSNVEVAPTTMDMKRDVWSRTRVLLMPSMHETSGRVGLEAICSGIPVICHPTPGLVETQGDAGIFVDRDNVQGWISEVRRLRDPAAWQEASDRALARAATWDSAGAVRTFVRAMEALV